MEILQREHVLFGVVKWKKANLLIYASRTSLLTLLTLFARSTEIPGPCCYMLLHAATCCYMEILQREHVLFGVVKWKKMEENGSWMRNFIG